MAPTYGWLLLILSIVSLTYASRINLCLATNGTVYKPLQLYPQDCPKDPANCMSEVYKYNATLFKSLAPSTLIPKAKESFVYMTQDENNVFDVVVMTVSSYKNNIIKTIFEVDGAAPGATTLVRDDPNEDQWNWNPLTLRGNATWLLQPSFTDGVVLGHFKFIDNYCFRVEFLPNWQGAIGNVVFLSGTVAKPVRVLTQKLVGNSVSSVFYEFCQYPQAMITKQDATCSSMGSATATSLSGPGTYLWQKDGVTVGTTSTVSNLSPGTYTVTITVAGCSTSRNVTIVALDNMNPISVSSTVVDQTKTKLGKITLSVSDGYPPFAVTWMDSNSNVIARNVTTVSVTAGSYTVTVADRCSSQTLHLTVGAPGSCPPGTRVDGDDCVPCPAGTYSTSSDSTMCTVCPPGSYNTVENSSSCSQCPANTVTEGGATPCSGCPANTQSAPGSAICSTCQPGSARSNGETACTPCPAGQFSCGKNACAPCQAGSFSHTGSSSCEACDPGTYSGAGSTMCNSCNSNTYAASGASMCTSCTGSLMAPAGSSSIAACM